MDVIVPAIPDSYDEYRATLRAFIAGHKPGLDVEAAQRACGCPIGPTTWSCCAATREPSTTPATCSTASAPNGVTRTSSASWSRSSRAAGIPHVLGNPLVAGALKHFGTDEQRAAYFPPMARGDHIWTQLFSEPDAGSDLTGAADAGHAGRQRLRRRGAEGVEHLGAVGGLRVPAGAHRAGGGCRRHHCVHPRHAQSRRRGPPAARDDRHDRLQRGVLRRGPRAGGQRHRRARRGMEGGRRQPGRGAHRCRAAPGRAPTRSQRLVDLARRHRRRSAGRPSRTAPCASSSGTWRPGHAFSATWANAWRPRRPEGQITRSRRTPREDLVERAEPRDGRGSPGPPGQPVRWRPRATSWPRRMGAGRTPSFTLVPTPSQEDRTRSCATSSPSGVWACPGSPRASRSVTATSRHEHTHATSTPDPPHAQRARGAAAANDPFPGVEKVRDGLWSIPVPLPNNSLRYVLVYVFETDRGPYLIDAGWNTDDAFGALSAGMEEVGCDMADVQGVMVTHIHPDHYGLAGRIREASGAWISLHPADAELIHDRYDEPDDLLDRVAAALRTHGRAGRGAGRRCRTPPCRSCRWSTRSSPTSCSRTGHKPEVPGWDLTAIWTPGHSPGHLCFYEATHELMLSGDHVLPRITPNIPYHPQAGANPLGDYLASLDKLEPYEVERGAAGARVPLRRPARPAGGAAPAPPGPFRRGHRHPAGGTTHAPGTSRTHEVVPALGRHRGVHAAGRRGRGRLAPACRSRSTAWCRSRTASPPCGP